MVIALRDAKTACGGRALSPGRMPVSLRHPGRELEPASAGMTRAEWLLKRRSA
jgi:hypothetical protein